MSKQPEPIAASRSAEPAPAASAPTLSPDALVQETGAVQRTFERKSTLASLLPSRSPKLIVGVVIVVAFILYAIIVPFFTRSQTFTSSFMFSHPGQNGFLLGSTQSGGDVFAQLSWGARGSLEIGLIVGLLATVLSTIFGVLGAYIGGYLDDAFALFTNVILVIPGLPLAIIIASYVPPAQRGWLMIALVLTITSWAGSARVLRSVTLSVRNRDYVLAARIAGEKTWRILVVEILPNLIPVMASQFIFSVIAAILSEAGLAFIGLGSATQYTLGKMLQQAYNGLAMTHGAWWWWFPPGILIALFGMGLSLINFSIDEIINPKLRNSTRAARKKWGLTPSQIRQLEEENMR
jgi:peptide/nickel transport system permease protein